MNGGQKVILYIHGMGGGGDSRIPSILKDLLGPGIEVVVRTYPFDPVAARELIGRWAGEVRPDLVIGESMGATHAIALKGFPHILISPSLNAPRFFSALAVLARIPGVTAFFDRLYKPKEGDRQSLHFAPETLSKWKEVSGEALKNTPLYGSTDTFHAFFGTRDAYRRSGVVLIRTWKKYFGKGTWTVYDGTHFMEEEYIRSLLVPKILVTLQIPKG